MSVVTLLVCLAAAPDRCHKVEIQVESCSAMGIASLAAWAARNPQYRVQKWWPCRAGVQA